MPLRARTLLSLLPLLAPAIAACTDADVEPTPLRIAPTVDQDRRVEAVDLSSTRVHVEVAGDPRGPVIIVLHGGPGDDLDYMKPLAGRAGGVSLADHYRLVFWDQRGTGQSRRHDPAELTLDAYARDLNDLIEHYAPGAQVGLLGHSWGGTYAVQYLNRHPERVFAAALLEPGGLSHALRDDDAIDEQRAQFEALVGGPLGHGATVSAGAHDRADAALDDLIAQISPDMPRRRPGALVLRQLELGALTEPGFDFTTHLDRVGIEVLFVVGALSDELGAATQDRQRLRFPRSRLAVIPDADHDALTLGKVDAVIPPLVDYFDGLRPAR